MQSILPSGVYPPLPTFFDDQEELDLATLRRHMRRLEDSGIAGYVLMGSNGEAVHLTDDERIQLITTAKEVVKSGEHGVPIVVGCGAQSTRVTITHCQQAAQHGADVALVLPPSYYRGQMNSQALITHYRAVADQSSIPILLYNMPASAAGIDLDVATIAALAEHPNIIGLKDSAGNIVKIAQIVDSVPASFRVFAGSASFFLPALVAGSVGTIAALANIFPHEVCLLQALFEAGEFEEARELQARIIPANAAVTTTYGVSGLKAALALTAGYGGKPRLPLLPLAAQECETLAQILAATLVDVE
ncbi:dihydrodipicolinate synthase family protein [Reticulibacter mediterranei]|uniref:Dihydrodipicolinate synthase family protein n=1 Tax=Reticulibacter mediterranei TaxID=2778369 RepID=A0A8J3MYG3_9CHLR|nr:dihydrodipicolinate synthase family protein [Reticulibacter mediterranei]GHO92019.1 dihydrodipicolinate synthase family protein [Reticulibacter mediterranei]